MDILGSPSTSIFDRSRNIALGFVIILFWVVGMQAFLSLFIEGYPTFVPRTPDFTFARFFFSCIRAPLWEELAFRVAPLTIAKTLNPKSIVPVVILSSIVFGLGHGYGTISLLFQGVMGLIFAWIYLKNGYNYLSAVSIHFLWNFFCFIFL